MPIAQAEIRDRRELIANAAIGVLAAEGGRGLTHRAVDRAAALPEGSTSNYFPTREALLTAALHRLVEFDAPVVQALEELVPAGPYDPRTAGELVAGTIHTLLEPERHGLSVARYELILEARRRPTFQRAFDDVRRGYARIVEQLLPAAGCRSPREHAPHLLATFDGLVFNQLFESATALPSLRSPTTSSASSPPVEEIARSSDESGWPPGSYWQR